MRLYLDTEFNGGCLISMALIAEDRRCFYEVLEFDATDPWVTKNVIPVLDKKAIPLETFQSYFHMFLRQFDNPEIICDWYADAEHFFRMFAGDEFETSLDWPCRLILLSTPPGQPISVIPHNALEDAIALMDWHLSQNKTMHTKLSDRFGVT